MTSSRRNIREIHADLRSPELPPRHRAMLALLEWIKVDPSIHPEALDILRTVWQSETDGYLATSAIDGIERIAGPAEAHAARLTLLDHALPQMVAYAVISLERRPNYPKFLELLARRPVTEVHTTIVSILGRTKNPELRAPIAALLPEPGVRPYAAQALGVLGDPRAIADLTPYVADSTPAWEVDNHGPMLSVGDVAQDSIAMLRRRTAPPTPAMPAPFHAPAANPPAAAPALGLWERWNVYIPLAAALFTVPWVLFVLVPQILVTGGRGRSPAEIQQLDMVGMVPGAIGILAGVAAIASRRPRTLGQSMILWIGCAACILAMAPFAHEALTRDPSTQPLGATTQTPNPPARPATIPAMPPKVDIRFPSLPTQPARP